MNKNELREINVTKGATVATTVSQIGTDIPKDKVRHIWKIIASAADGSEQNITFYAGDSANKERENLGTVRVPDITNTGPMVLGEDIENPILTIRPQYDGSTITYNGLYAKAETSNINVIVNYYDE